MIQKSIPQRLEEVYQSLAECRVRLQCVSADAVPAIRDRLFGNSVAITSVMDRVRAAKEFAETLNETEVDHG